MTLALIGSPYGETEPRKATYFWADVILSLTLPEISTPQHQGRIAAKSKGFWRLNWLHLTGQNNQTDGTNKNVSEVYGWSHSW
jgi:hypothetical protein